MGNEFFFGWGREREEKKIARRKTRTHSTSKKQHADFRFFHHFKNVKIANTRSNIRTCETRVLCLNWAQNRSQIQKRTHTNKRDVLVSSLPSHADVAWYAGYWILVNKKRVRRPFFITPLHVVVVVVFPNFFFFYQKKKAMIITFFFSRDTHSHTRTWQYFNIFFYPWGKTLFFFSKSTVFLF